MKKIVLIGLSSLLAAMANGQEITKDEWSGQMKTALPQYFCTSEQYFRQCFNVDESECKVVAANATNACLNQFAGKIPARLKQSADGAHWGNQVGMCARNAYEVALLRQRIKNPKCNNPNNWK